MGHCYKYAFFESFFATLSVNSSIARHLPLWRGAANGIHVHQRLAQSSAHVLGVEQPNVVQYEQRHTVAVERNNCLLEQGNSTSYFGSTYVNTRRPDNSLSRSPPLVSPAYQPYLSVIAEQDRMKDFDF